MYPFSRQANVRSNKKPQKWGLAAAAALTIALALTGCSSDTDSVFRTSSSYSFLEQSRSYVDDVPYDYQVVQSKVDNIIGDEIFIMPEREFLLNDQKYAVGDKVWALQFKGAEVTSDSKERTRVWTTAWKTIKTYKDKKSAVADMDKLKLTITTEIDLVGLYKTTYKGETRHFAVVELPSGNRVKQLVDDARYERLSKGKTATVHLEEIHDYYDYDLVFSKFRGWAD
ncbi:signal peptide protein [Paenibacillus sp. GCM10027627]|uniref:signal peptide protein n=1 Tax=unclassified Paenibacillus TaxID=185978 RepID=UPI0036439178